MKVLNIKEQKKFFITALTIVVVGLIAAIIIPYISSLDTVTIAQQSTVESDPTEVSIIEHKPVIIDPVTNNNAQPVTSISQGEAQGQETKQLQEPKQSEVIIQSIQEAQPKIDVNPTPQPAPVVKATLTDKTYTESNVKPQQSQPKMGDRNDKGQVYVEGFGWIKDEGGGGKGTTVGSPGDKLTGNKVGTMN